MENEQNQERSESMASVRRVWETPSLTKTGTIAEILQGGTGKASASSADSGDAGKPPGQG